MHAWEEFRNLCRHTYTSAGEIGGGEDPPQFGVGNNAPREQDDLPPTIRYPDHGSGDKTDSGGESETEELVQLDAIREMWKHNRSPSKSWDERGSGEQAPELDDGEVSPTKPYPSPTPWDPGEEEGIVMGLEEWIQRVDEEVEAILTDHGIDSGEGHQSTTQNTITWGFRPEGIQRGMLPCVWVFGIPTGNHITAPTWCT